MVLMDGTAQGLSFSVEHCDKTIGKSCWVAKFIRMDMFLIDPKQTIAVGEREREKNVQAKTQRTFLTGIDNPDFQGLSRELLTDNKRISQYKDRPTSPGKI